MSEFIIRIKIEKKPKDFSKIFGTLADEFLAWVEEMDKQIGAE